MDGERESREFTLSVDDYDDDDDGFWELGCMRCGSSSGGTFKKIQGNFMLKVRQIFSVYTYLPTPPLRQDMTQGQFLSRV